MQRGLSPLNFVRIIADLSAVAAAWVIAFYLRFYTIFDAPKGVPDAIVYVRLLPFIVVIWLATFSAAGFYQRSGRHRSAFTEGLDIIQSCGLATLAFIAFTYFYDEYRYSRGTIAVFAALHPWVIIAGRSVIRKMLRRYRRSIPPKRTLCIVSKDLLDRALAIVDVEGPWAHQIVGCIVVGAPIKGPLDKLPILPEPSDWQAFLIQENIQRVIFAVSNDHYHVITDRLDVIANQVSDIQMIPDLFRFTRFSAGIQDVRGVPVINIHASPLDGVGAVHKRIMDVCLSSLGLIVVSPIMLITALLVKLTSPGPVFYRQERMGLDGRRFNILKFRSMPVDAERKTGAVWASADDNRPTRLGKFLRKSSIDELPQLFNILAGHMSLVGPRPERPVFVENFRQQIPGYMLRHKVKAGLTGWAQVNGWRGNTSLEKRIECDLYYIQNWSLWLDFKIILFTSVRIFFERNAY
jgi:Undecaprenyl-phosphate glucose phosphotransferase